MSMSMTISVSLHINPTAIMSMKIIKYKHECMSSIVNSSEGMSVNMS